MRGGDSLGSEGGARRSSRRRHRRSRHKMRRTAGLLAFAGLIVLPLLAFGGQHLPVLVLAAVLGASAVLLLSREETQPPVLALGLLALAGFSAFQLLPLPAGVVRWVSPAAASIWSEAFHPFREPAPRFMSLSVDPAATALEVVKWSTYACAAIAASTVRAVHGSARVASLIFGSALFVLLLTLVHGVFDAQRIYGIYPVIDLGERWTRGPLVNGNNLAGLLNLGVFAGAGLWLSGWLGRHSWLALLGAILMSTGVVLTGSRGGVLALMVGAVFFAVLAYRQGHGKGGVVAAAMALVVAASATAVALVGDARLVRGLTDTGVHSKVAVWGWSLPMIREFPLFGVGRGAFETAFQPYRGALARGLPNVYAHAENFPVDWVAEWGIPVGLAALVGLAFRARRLWSRAARHPLAGGLTVALAALFLQNLVDLGLEIFGVMVLAVVALVVAEDRPRSRRSKWWARLPAIATGASLAASIVALLFQAAPVQSERYRMRDALTAAGTSSAGLASFRADLRAAVRRHPGEAYFPLLGAYAAPAWKEDSLPWLARALTRGPRYGQVHLALADWMRGRGRLAQSFMHLRLAAFYDVTLEEPVMARAVKWSRSFDELGRGFPSGAEGSGLLGKLCARVAEGWTRDCWKEVALRDPSNHAARLAYAQVLVAALEAARPPCDPALTQACAVEAGLAVQNLTESEHGWRAGFLRARLRAYQGDKRGAAQSLLESCPLTDEAAPCLGLALDFAVQTRDADLVVRVADRFLAARCAAEKACAVAEDRVGNTLAELGAWSRALGHYVGAAKADPTAGRWDRVADCATRADAPTVAQTAALRAAVLRRTGHNSGQ